ncbi:hypothetical protein [Roseibacillus persicicus]|nr:hypothetical protein [Roseibacillus persicicus]
MMVLLSLLALGLLGLSAMVLRGREANSAQLEARANARLALQMAIAQLQRTAGPDQRVTASAAFAGNGYPEQWTGVWRTGEEVDGSLMPAVGYGSDWGTTKSFKDRRESVTSWRSDWFLEPLVTNVSNSSPEAVSSLASATDSLPAVEVPLLGIGQSGALGWWTDDRSQRTSVAPGRNADSVGEEAFASAPRHDSGALVEEKWETDFFRDSHERELTVTDQSLALAASTSPLPAQSQAVARSYGLFTDSVFGGLKGDLTRFVESEGQVFGRDEELGLAGIDASASMLSEKFHESSGPKWQRLRSWFQLSRTGSSSGLTSMEAENTRVARKAFGGEGYSVDAMASLEQPVHPMVVDAGFHWDFTPEDETGSSFYCHIYPRVSLWNPYNTQLTSEPMVILMPKHIDSGGGLSVEVSLRGQVEIIPTVVRGWGEQFRTAGSPTEHYFMFTIEPTTFEAGECLVFTPKVNARVGMQPYDDRVVSRNILTANQPVGPENFTLSLQSRNSLLQQRLARGATVTRYISTPWDSQNYQNALHWNPKPFLLKQGTAGNMTSRDVMTRESHATLQRLYVNDGGAGEDYFAESGKRAGYIRMYPGWSNDAENNGSEWGTFASNPNRHPPRRWHYRVHLSWLDDIEELRVVGRINNPQPPYEAAVMADWNPIASVVCRTPSTYLREHFDLHVGPWYRCKAAHDAHGGLQNWGVFIEGKARGCPNANPLDFASELAFPVIDLPSRNLPLQSLGQLRHAPLSPWLWHPLRIVGNSRPSLHATADETSLPTIAQTRNPWTRTVVQTDAVFDDLVQSDDHKDVLLYDISHEVNRRLWDSYFASSWEEDFDEELNKLPNALYRPHPTLRADKDLMETGSGRQALSFWLPAYLLVNEGAFNVNTLSTESWLAFLSGMKDVSRPSSNGQEMAASHPFSRFRQPLEESGFWGGGVGLDDSQLSTLSSALVEVVRERGPFLGVSDFVNRRLSKDETQSRAGALDEAIQRASLRYEEGRDFLNMATDQDSAVPPRQRLTQEHNAEWLLDGAPGILEQSDILEPLGGTLCARGDTFRIRATGISKDESGRILAQVYCEATVVRSPEYLLAGDLTEPGSSTEPNSALLRPYLENESDSTLQANPDMHPLNLKYGRRFEVLDFRWLTPSEI